MNENVVNSVGEILRSAREAKNLTLEKAHQDTKISVRVLGALEQDDFESFESDIYLKGFLKTYAQYLGVEVSHVLKTLSQQRGGRVSSSRAALWDIEETVTEEKLKSPRIFRRFVLPVLIAVIVILVVLFVNERRKVRDLTRNKSQSYLKMDNVDRHVA
jgi:cytoskeleton protein RodZ